MNPQLAGNYYTSYTPGFDGNYTNIGTNEGSVWVKNSDILTVDFWSFFNDLSMDINGNDFFLTLKIDYGNLWVVGNYGQTGAKSVFQGLNVLNFESYAEATVIGKASNSGEGWIDRNGNRIGDYGFGLTLTSSLTGYSSKMTLSQMIRPDASSKVLNNIKLGSKYLGQFASGLSLSLSVYTYTGDPTWGNAARVGVNGLAFGLSFGGPYSAGFGLGISIADSFGAFNGVYNGLDFNQQLYNNTGHVLLPSVPPFSLTPSLIRLK